MNTLKENMVEEAKDIEKQASSLAEKHRTIALEWNRANFWQGTLIAVTTPILSIGTTSSVVIQYFVHSLLWSIITFFLSLLVTILTSVVALHKPSERGALHEKAKNDYSYLSNQARHFYMIEIYDETKADRELAEQVKDLLNQLYKLNQTSPAIPSRRKDRLKNNRNG